MIFRYVSQDVLLQYNRLPKFSRQLNMKNHTLSAENRNMESRKIYSTLHRSFGFIHHIALWECVSGLPQYEATKAYMPKEPDELGLQQAELVIVLQKEEGETLVVTTCNTNFKSRPSS